jgi:hypothetical protein
MPIKVTFNSVKVMTNHLAFLYPKVEAQLEACHVTHRILDRTKTYRIDTLLLLDIL